ncbi:MAG: TIGR03667 family PPOX class F420-dependent oxidoreductase [Solirubrobacteraceae bacterium]
MTLVDESTEFGARAAAHLRDDVVIWMTTVSAAGSPVPSPVWFLWDGDELVSMYSVEGVRIRNIESNRRVALNFDGNGKGGDIVVLTGRAKVERGLPGADRNAVYLAKYAEHIKRIGMTPESFAAKYSVPVHIELRALRGF